MFLKLFVHINICDFANMRLNLVLRCKGVSYPMLILSRKISFAIICKGDTTIRFDDVKRPTICILRKYV